MSNNYALIKDSNIINVIVIKDANQDTLEHFKTFFGANSIVNVPNTELWKCKEGTTYDGNAFWLSQPFPSWIKNEEFKDWEPPVPYPNDGKYYSWDESSLSWVEQS